MYIVDAQDKVVAHRDPSVVLRGTSFRVPDKDGIHPGLTGYSVVLAADRVRLGGQEFEVRTWDAVCIRPGPPHRIRNNGEKELKILCCCAPAYSHEDTELME